MLSTGVNTHFSVQVKGYLFGIIIPANTTNMYTAGATHEKWKTRSWGPKMQNMRTCCQKTYSVSQWYSTWIQSHSHELQIFQSEFAFDEDSSPKDSRSCYAKSSCFVAFDTTSMPRWVFHVKRGMQCTMSCLIASWNNLDGFSCLVIKHLWTPNVLKRPGSLLDWNLNQKGDQQSESRELVTRVKSFDAFPGCLEICFLRKMDLWTVLDPEHYHRIMGSINITRFSFHSLIFSWSHIHLNAPWQGSSNLWFKSCRST